MNMKCLHQLRATDAAGVGGSASEVSPAASFHHHFVSGFDEPRTVMIIIDETK